MNHLLVVLLIAICTQALFFFVEKLLNKIKIHPEYRLFTYQVSHVFMISLPLLLWLSQKESKFIKFVATPIKQRQVSIVTQMIKSSSISFSSYIPHVYFFITAILLFRLFNHYRKTKKLLNNAESTDLFDKKVYLGQNSSPFCFGLLRPRIYWPRKFNLNESLKEVAFTHEQHHQKNRDPLWILINRIMNTFLWISPLTYFMNKRFPLIIEERCDAQTLESSKISAKDYGSFLLSVEVSQNLNNSLFVHFNQSDLRRRIMTMKQNTIKFKNLKLTILILTSLLGLSIMAVGHSSQKKESSQYTPFYALDSVITIDNIDIFNSKIILRDDTQGVINMTSSDGIFMLKVKANAQIISGSNKPGVVVEMAMKRGDDIDFKPLPKIFAFKDQNGHLNYQDDQGRMVKVSFLIKDKKMTP